MKQLLTHSRQASFKTCRRQHYYRYELGLRRIDDAKALRMGSAFHAGSEALSQTDDLDIVYDAARRHYRPMPDRVDPYWWEIERETIVTLLCGYRWRWQNSGVTNIETEKSFRLPLVNPSTGAETPVWDLAGKIDGIVRIEDGRLAIKETKTVSDDISPDSSLWRRLRIDHQISLYVYAARKLGYQVDTVLYDLIRKPSIAPTPVPLLDDQGRKIVLDAAGNRAFTAKGEFRQTGDKEKGLTLQARPMTAEEWSAKLLGDIYDRPEFYFARVEIPRLDQDIDEYQNELWDIQLTIREAQRSGRWYRTVGPNTCQYCEHFDHCCTNQTIDVQSPPDGFEIVSNLHPELEESVYASATSGPTQSTTAPAIATTA